MGLVLSDLRPGRTAHHRRNALHGASDSGGPGHGFGFDPVTLAQAVKDEARRLGFIACGITDPRPTAHADRLDEWLSKGYAGTMRYLHRQATRRKDPSLIAPEARSVVVVLDNYYTPDEPTDLEPPRVAKYARGEDYHEVTRRRLGQLGDFLQQHGARLARTYTDAGPVPERELAQRAGLGWIGKNTMLVNPDAGSFFFIGSVFTDLALELDLPFEMDRCGSCTRCLDACPTRALLEPRLLDATRCISYLTIEYRGVIPSELGAQLQGYVFGCDICNDVCPWNQRFAEPTQIPEFRTGSARLERDPDFFENMTEAEFSERFGSSPLERAGLEGMRRNYRSVFVGARAESRTA